MKEKTFDRKNEIKIEGKVYMVYLLKNLEKSFIYYIILNRLLSIMY